VCVLVVVSCVHVVLHKHEVRPVQDVAQLSPACYVQRLLIYCASWLPGGYLIILQVHVERFIATRLTWDETLAQCYLPLCLVWELAL